MISLKKYIKAFVIFACLLLQACDGSSNKKSVFVLEEATIQSVHLAITNKNLTCEKLVRNYIERIKLYNLSIDNNKPPLNAIVAINNTAIEQARNNDNKFNASNKLSGPLHCIPVVIKDNINAYDMPASSGSLSLLGNQPIEDAYLVKKLREAGAVILATTSMDEFASGITGISSKSGRVGNVYNTLANPGGSSGGSAVAVSANFSMLAIGTDNSGSVRIPAAFNGIVGLRPSMGLISQDGIFPRGNIDGTAGPMARTIADLSSLLDVIAEADKSYTSSLKKGGLKNKRIGILARAGEIDTFNKMPTQIQNHFKQVITNMEQLGATIVSDIKVSQYDQNRKYNQSGELEDVNNYLQLFPAVRKDYNDICNSKRSIVFTDAKKCLDEANNFPKKNSKQYFKALEILSKNRASLEKVMNENNIDALLLPVSTTGIATYDLELVGPNQLIASNAGLPAITFPGAYSIDENMPIGIELIARKYNESTLIEMAYAYEQQYNPRVAPDLPNKSNALLDLEISKLNNLYTTIGYNTYYNILSKDNFNKEDLYKNSEEFNNIVKPAVNEATSYEST